MHKIKKLSTAGISTQAVIVIPAYQPTETLYSILLKLTQRYFVVVVNDGSDKRCNIVFEKIKILDHVAVLNHPVNLGKGQALKTAFNFVLNSTELSPLGVITADADGQHLPEDIFRVADYFCDHPHHFLLGSRKFDENIPWRSKIGNKITQKVFSLLSGAKLQDTQTGLRAIPIKIMPLLLKIPSSAYDFELDMLLAATKQKLPIVEIPISTIYLDSNSSSHFNPLIDSLKIYFVFIRFSAVAILCGLIDYIGFIAMYLITGNIFISELSARLMSGSLYFIFNKNFVFRSDAGLVNSFMKYSILVMVNLLFSYSLIQLAAISGFHVFLSKLFALILMFILNFSVQRIFIFPSGK